MFSYICEVCGAFIFPWCWSLRYKNFVLSPLWFSSFSAHEIWFTFIQFKFTCRLNGNLKLIERKYFLMSVYGIAWFSTMSRIGINGTDKHWLREHWVVNGRTCWCCRNLLPCNWNKSGSRATVLKNSFFRWARSLFLHTCVSFKRNRR